MISALNVSGPSLDVLARQHLWKSGLNYNHGTGHGIGAFLNVHEGPHGISSSSRKESVLKTALQPGMLVTNGNRFSFIFF
jgi:Xaa-Pro aminopeptidase